LGKYCVWYDRARILELKLMVIMMIPLATSLFDSPSYVLCMFSEGAACLLEVIGGFHIGIDISGVCNSA
jgi:hypothetical protein